MILFSASFSFRWTTCSRGPSVQIDAKFPTKALPATAPAWPGTDLRRESYVQIAPELPHWLTAWMMQCADNVTNVTAYGYQQHPAASSSIQALFPVSLTRALPGPYRSALPLWFIHGTHDLGLRQVLNQWIRRPPDHARASMASSCPLCVRERCHEVTRFLKWQKVIFEKNYVIIM